MDSRILVIEDDPDIREDLCDLLRGQGFQVEDATGGATAIEVLNQAARDTIVLLDPFVAQLERDQVLEILARASTVLTIPVALKESTRNGTGSVGLRREPVHYGVLVDAVREEIRRRRSKVQGLSAAGPAGVAAASERDALMNGASEGWRLAPWWSRFGNAHRSPAPNANGARNAI